MRLRKELGYSTAFKCRLVLEVFQSGKPLWEVANAYDIEVETLRGWKDNFLLHAEFAIAPSQLVKKYELKLAQARQQQKALMKELKKMKAEKEWLEKRANELGFVGKRDV